MGSPEKGLREPSNRDLPSSPPAATGKGPGAAGPSLSPFPRPHAMPLPECPLLTSRGWSRGRRCEADGGLRWVPARSEAAEGLGKAPARFFSPQECVGMDPVRDLKGGLQGDCCLPPLPSGSGESPPLGSTGLSAVWFNVKVLGSSGNMNSSLANVQINTSQQG